MAMMSGSYTKQTALWSAPSQIFPSGVGFMQLRPCSGKRVSDQACLPASRADIVQQGPTKTLGLELCQSRPTVSN